MSATSLRSLASDFGDAGVFGALRRGLALVATRPPLPPLPPWLLHPSFAEACCMVAAAEEDAATLVAATTALRATERALRVELSDELQERGVERAAARWQGAAPTHCDGPLPEHGADGVVPELAMAVAAARLAAGAVAEAALALAATTGAWCGRRSVVVRAKVTAAERRAARLYADAHLVAIWTSAHAEYVAQVQSGVEEPPPPSLFTVPNAAADLDWSELFGRRWCPRQCVNKNALALLNCLTRCTNPGSRGWDSLLASEPMNAPALRIVEGNAMTVCMSGMHPHLHPALRLPWWLRFRALRVLQDEMGSGAVRGLLVDGALYTKEAVRRLLASTVAATPAVHAALGRLNHPVGLLTTPPLRLPHRGMEGAMEAFAAVGEALLDANAAGCRLDALVASTFQRHSLRGGERAANVAIGWPSSISVRRPTTTATAGSHTAARRPEGTASVHGKVAWTSVAAELWSSAFRTHFVPFWLHAMLHKTRSMRLDPAQHAALHELNAATRLTLTLSREDALAVQRAALSDASAGILTLAEVGERLGVVVSGTSSNGGTRNPEDTLRALAAAGPRDAARLLAYARVAWLSEQLLVVDLGARTRGLQIQALFRRLERPSAAALAQMRPEDVPETALLELPVHATHAQACVECKRFANAVVLDAGKPGRGPQTFNELGVAVAMLCMSCRGADAGTVHIRCAKRSSAALRTAVNFEEEMESQQVEACARDAPAVAKLLRQPKTTGAGNSDSGVAARVRRDAKNALEQRAVATACGEEPMISIPAVGRALRLWNEWYALCAYCGVFVKLQPHLRCGTEICCLRCDAQMLGVAARPPTRAPASTPVPAPTPAPCAASAARLIRAAPGRAGRWSKRRSTSPGPTSGCRRR